jgi:hypothetical protein
MKVKVQRGGFCGECFWFLVPGFGFWVSGFGFRVSGSGFRVSGFGLQAKLTAKSQQPKANS